MSWIPHCSNIPSCSNQALLFAWHQDILIELDVPLYLQQLVSATSPYMHHLCIYPKLPTWNILHSVVFSGGYSFQKTLLFDLLYFPCDTQHLCPLRHIHHSSTCFYAELIHKWSVHKTLYISLDVWPLNSYMLWENNCHHQKYSQEHIHQGHQLANGAKQHSLFYSYHIPSWHHQCLVLPFLGLDWYWYNLQVCKVHFLQPIHPCDITNIYITCWQIRPKWEIWCNLSLC